VYYLDSGQAQRFDLQVNGGTAQTITLPTAVGGRTMARHTLTIDLQAGDNTLRLTPAASLAIDRIVVDTGT
jgi:hypothetical protein